MNNGIVIIGSGFAARQLVKNIRKQDTDVPVTVIADDSIDEYNKPDLSHVISLGQHADDLTRQTADEFATQYNLQLFPFTRVMGIDADAREVIGQVQKWKFDRLVLATGASACVPPVPGHELILTLNSQTEYRNCESRLLNAQRVLIVGGGLIGSELAMDFCRAGKAVTVVDSAASILASLMLPEVSGRLQHRLTEMGVHLLLSSQLRSLAQTETGVVATFDRSRSVEVDVVIAATGLRPRVALAQGAGVKVNRGIVVNSLLQTSCPDIYALGDCAEINGQVLPFLQPIQLSAMYLAKNLLGGEAPLKLPAMLVKVKTPAMPLHLAGETSRRDLSWQISAELEGMVAKGLDAQGQLRAFVVSEDRMKEAFALLKAMPA
ncbi:nitric oxide reductase FlRd-NAD(+) reductase [Leminorella grimontii]|uniref:Nitric oxide reductase FlRd-NAD(+) reductase n=1 Tax=Leminorella grimontii TaxID=82981 RepID=A0AAV5N7B2_9GAMM|nr:NADH:flavorubredoxin reductase NorW [Leminorella grimontii]KFC94511.1 nitric oxide reductase FlRd-NAD(+) reductase [Leminorella grimontii ATCC 33999 = DSM 5078]GKX56607.1 nitric oxide reductase FlRd-NAD(+) reductase [Leminorella grimontii]VFS61744.1 Nitric oxide reductase FlRd-NAD(+) reductase [Leminorella grimontii]